MASVSVTFVSACDGGCHVQVLASIDGGQAQTVRLNRDDVLTPLAPIEAPDVINDILRVRWRGKTAAQMRADLQAGITMTV
jgi:hypothetical protein